MLLAGAIPSALLAIVLDFLLSLVQKASVRKLRLIFFAGILIFAGIMLAKQFSSNSGIRLKAGFTPEFMGRRDGDLGLRSVYGLNIKPVVISDAVMYKAAYEKKLDVISGYGTDGRLKAYDLVTLEDDRHIFPPYYAVPLIRKDALKSFPRLEGILNKLEGRISDSVMTALNYKVDYLHQSPQQVAKDFLISQNLWKAPVTAGSKTVRIGSKIFGEQYILAAMYSMLIRGYSDLNVSSKTGLGGTQICFNALKNNEIDLYPEYTGTGLLVILQSPPSVIEKISKDKDSTYQYVNKEFERIYQMKLLRPIGFNNTYALMMRRRQAADLRIRTISDLKEYISH